MDNISLLFDMFVLGLLVLGVQFIVHNNARFSYYTKRNKAKNMMEAMMKLTKTVDLKNAGRKRKEEKEIYEGISFMRNILTLNAGQEIRADVIIEKLANRKGILQPAYVKMLGCLRLNRASEAVAAFDATGCQANGKEYASLLTKWDEINPEELSEILISIQRGAREKRITEQKRRDEMISDLIYLPVVLNVLMIFINFLYVSYFLDQQEMLMRFF